MTVLSKHEQELYEMYYRFIFLKCNSCNFKFAIRSGFYTVCSCPNCKKDVHITDKDVSLDNLLSKEKKLELTNEYHFRKFMSKMVR